MSKKTNPNAVYLGRAVACTRLEQGMKRKQLAVAAGISYPFLAEIENGKKWPSFATLDLLAEALGCASLYLLARAKQIGDDFPVICGDGCDCWEDAIHSTAVRRGWDGGVAIRNGAEK
jgi:transcriptional regulator with XRE-family HTH domain